MKLKLKRNIKIAYILIFFSSLYFYSHVGTLYLQARGLDLSQVAILTSVLTIGILLFEIPTGLIADKIGRKKSVVIAIFIQALGEYLYFFANNFIHFILISLLAGIGFAFLSGALDALIYESVEKKNKEKKFTQIMGNITALHQTAFFLGPLIGSLIIQKSELSDYLRGILVTAFMVTIAFIASLFLFENKKPRSQIERSRKLLIDSFKGIFQNKNLLYIASVGIFTYLFRGFIESFYQPYFIENGFSAVMIGVSLSLGALLSALVLKNINFFLKKLKPKLFIILTFYLPGLLFILFGLNVNKLLLIPIFLLIFALTIARDPILANLVNKNVENRIRATTISVINMGGNIYRSLVGIIFGSIAEKDMGNSFVIIGIVIIVSNLIFNTFGKVPKLMVK